MHQLRVTPFHQRTAPLCLPQNWRRWAGYLVAGSYDLTIDREYWAIRNTAALIDVSPLCKYLLHGSDAARLLHRMTTRNILKMPVGQVLYTGWCDDDGKLIDDGTVARLDVTTFRLTSAEPALRWLLLNATGLDVIVEDVSDVLAAISLQGPYARMILNRVCLPPLDGLKYFHIMHTKLAGHDLTISRTGYTGDLGFEIWLPAENALPVWDALVEAGHDYSLTPTGILAMDIARVEAGLFMLDVDYTSTSHAWIETQKSSPYELGLDWTVNLDKPGYFVGRQALEREQRSGPQWKLIGLEVDWPGMEAHFAAAGLPPQIPTIPVRASLPVYSGSTQVGYASTSAWSPLLKKYIALAHLRRPFFDLGTPLSLEITVEHQRKKAPAVVVKLPFYEPEWKKK